MPNFSSSKIPIFILLFLTASIILLPLFIVFFTSFSSGNIYDNSLTFNNYFSAWQRGHFPRAFANSTLVALGVTAFQLFTSSLAGYALARFQFWGKNLILIIVIATLVIPFQLLVIPIFLVLKWGNLINTYWALILPTAANGFGIFLMRQYFLSIPYELEEAASLDGANRLQILSFIMLPLAKPALITLFLFTFIGEWNDLFKPLVFTTKPQLQTVQLALASFQEQFTNNWPLMMAAVVIATIPVLILFLIGQKQFIRGIGSTGIKN
jgi:multiple sugar transport system permease protein